MKPLLLVENKTFCNFFRFVLLFDCDPSLNKSMFPISSKDTGPSLLGSMSLSSNSPSPASYSEAKTVSGSNLLNGPMSYSQQSSDSIKVRHI